MENQRIIDEEAHYQRLESRSPIRKAVSTAADYTINAIRTPLRQPIPLTRHPVSAREHARQTQQARRRLIERDMVPTVTQRARFRGIGYSLDAFSQGISEVRNLAAQPVDHMGGFTSVLVTCSHNPLRHSTLMPSVTKHPFALAGMPSAVSAFTLGHGSRLDSILITPMTCQASAGKAPSDPLANFHKNVLGNPNKKKKSKTVLATMNPSFKLF